MPLAWTMTRSPCLHNMCGTLLLVCSATSCLPTPWLISCRSFSSVWGVTLRRRAQVHATCYLTVVSLSSGWYCVLHAHMTSCASPQYQGLRPLVCNFPLLGITKPNITNNFRHLPSPQEQPPSGVLVIVYLYLFQPACWHTQTRVLAQTSEILATRNTCWKDFDVPYW